ncbi:MAG: hypothetical protein AAF417_02420 [Pseudomonadota bacterium]
MKTTCVSLIALTALLAACGDSSNNRAPVNQAPTISAITDISTAANQPSAPIPFSVADEELGSLTITATSDRPNVVPDSGLSISGSGANRTLTATPIDDVVGDTLISLVLTDRDGLSASTSFLLTIDAEERSIQQFVRDQFAAAEDDEPTLVNAVEFLQDADDDDFADLLAQ